MGGISFGILFGTLFFVLAFCVYWLNAFFIIYHLTRFGIGTYPKLIALVFFAGSVALFAAVLITFGRMDVTAAMEQFNINFLKDLPKTY